MLQEERHTLGRMASIRVIWQLFWIVIRLRLRWISAETLEQLLISRRTEPVVCGFCAFALEHRYGYSPVVGRIVRRAYEEEPNNSWLVFLYIKSLHHEERYDEIRNVNIIPCLDGEDECSKYVRQMHHYAEQRYKDNQHDGF